MFGKKCKVCGKVYNRKSSAIIRKSKYCSQKCCKIDRRGKPSGMKGKKHSIETREKMSVAHLGSKNYWFGKKLSKKHRINMGKSRIGRIVWNKGLKGWNAGEKNSSWKGGRYIMKGYIYIYSPSHPSIKNKLYVAEHRLIIEKHLGRYLKPSEVVHHINGITDDNRIENLMCFSSESAHQRFHHNPANVKPEEIIFDGKNYSKIMISKRAPL